VADRFDQPGFTGLTLDTIRRLLADREVPEELGSDLALILEDCDFVQYAPSDAGTTEEMSALAGKARDVLKKLEQKL